MRGLVLSPAASQIAFPKAFAPSSQSFHAGASHLGGTPQWVKSFRLMAPTAPSDRQYSAFSGEPTTATARPPAWTTSWIARDPSPPAPPQTRTRSPGCTVWGGHPTSMRYAVPPVSVGAAASYHVRWSAFGRH